MAPSQEMLKLALCWRQVHTVSQAVQTERFLAENAPTGYGWRWCKADGSLWIPFYAPTAQEIKSCRRAHKEPKANAFKNPRRQDRPK